MPLDNIGDPCYLCPYNVGVICDDCPTFKHEEEVIVEKEVEKFVKPNYIKVI